MKSILGIMLTVMGISSMAQQKDTIPAISSSSEKTWSVLWHQHAAEYRALCLQSFQMAAMTLELETAKTSPKPLAIITDIDETILDNSFHEANAILTGSAYSKQSWKEWTDRSMATPIPGAVEFLTLVQKKGVVVFYVSNRDTNEIPSTIINLKKYNLPYADRAHMLFMSHSSSKQSRRKTIEKDYKIILLLGDNLNDFMDVFEKKDIETRNREVDNYKSEWGKKFILLPNAIYGEWENALYGYRKDLSAEEKNKIRKQLLKGF